MFRSLTKSHFSSRFLQLKSHLVRHQLSTLNTQQSSNSPNPNLKGSLNDLNFINTAVKALPIDPNPSNKTRLVLLDNSLYLILNRQLDTTIQK